MRVPSRRSRSTLAVPGLILLVGLLGACASGRDDGSEAAALEPVRVVATDPLAVAPPDFQIDVLVLAGPLHAPGERVDQRPMRVTISPDGSLHAAIDPDVSARTVPQRIRTLDRPTLAGLWTTAGTLGLLDPDLEAPPVHPATVEVGLDELVAVVSIRAEGRHRSIIERAGGPGSLDRDLTAFIRQLADLAWASDRVRDAVRVIPRRYDLGDDPYRRFREPAAAAAGAGAG